VARQVETVAGRIEAEPPLGLAARIVGLAKEAMGRLRGMEMEYFSRSQGRLGRRRIFPYGIYEQGGHWYIVAFEEASGGIRTFRADRVRDARVTDHTYEIPAEFDVGKYRRDGPPAPEEGASAVTIVFDESVARFVRESFAAGDIRTRPSGDLEIVVRTTGPAWILSLLLRWGGAAVVEGPEDVRDALCARARETLAKYGR
jgi:proteasome accessory factor C